MLKGRNIIVTGANRGIGYSIVENCAKNGANVWACIRRETNEIIYSFEQLSLRYGVSIRIVHLDLNDENSIKEAAKMILEDKVKIDGLVNNAGITGNNRLFSMTTMGEIKDAFQVNFFGPMYFLQRLIKKMIRMQNISIVNVASVAAIDGEPAQLEYVASKAAVIGATKKLASELGQFNIRVNAIAPGMTETDMINEMDEKLKNKTLARTILKRLAKTEEISNAIVFLLSDQSSFMTGQVIRVDGGEI